MSAPPRHVALLGDSIFDNGSYVGAEPDVISHLRAILPAAWRATLCAIDGSTTSDVVAQISRVPPDATDLVVSMGGNDALMNSDLLDRTVKSTAEALGLFAGRCANFEDSYGRALDRLLRLERPVTVCTIYEGNFSDPVQARLASTALKLFNDSILRTAFRLGLPIIDLRLVCTAPADYANPIEPSGPGGAKIARAIAAAVGGLERDSSCSMVFGEA